MSLNIHQLPGKIMETYLFFPKQKMKYLIYFFAICTFLWKPSGITCANQDKEKILSLLEGRHWTLNSDEFLRLGRDTDSYLIEIARDPKMINYLRFRAIEALSLFPTEKTAEFLETTSENSFGALARRSFQAFRNGFYKTQTTRVKNLASRLLRHSNASLRIVAARAMRSIDTSRFEDFLNSEKNAWVRKEAKN